MSAIERPPTGSVRVLRRHLLAEWRALAVAGLSTLLVTAAELARPVPLALVIDRLLDGRQAPFELTRADATLLALVAGLVLLISAADSLGNYAAESKLRQAGERIIHELRLAAHAQLQRLSLSFHERRHTGDLVTRVTGDVNAVGELFSQSLGVITQAVLLLLGMLVVSVIIDPVLALAAFGAAPLLALVTFRFRRRLKRAARRQRTKEGEIATLATESFGAARLVKALGAESFEHGRLRRHSEERLEAGLETYRIETRFTGIVDLLSSVGLALVLVVGVLRVASGAVTPGEIVIMSSYARRVYRPLRDIARQAGRISRALARAERVGEILVADEVLAESSHAYRGAPARGELELEGVSFAYEGGRPALSELSLKIPAGERVAIVGPSGAGKSTLAALVARFYDPARGRVLIDGRDVRDCAVPWLRRQVGMVLQETILFTGTAAENIAYGIEARREDVVAAAKAAGADAFISELPDGYETALGAEGVALSGGQRQRIAIARALLRDPAILVLDEPTSGLDEESEQTVLLGLEHLMRGRTTLMITHSPRLAARADRVVTIEDGGVAGDRRTGVAVNADRGHVAVAPAAPTVPASTPDDSTAEGSSPPVPADPALDRMEALLNTRVMAPALERSLGYPAGPLDVRVRYLRYKPATNLVVHYDATIDGRIHGAVAMIAAKPFLRRRSRKPANVALAAMVNGRSPASTPLAYDPELEALIQWLPLDLALPGLAEPPERLAERLGRSWAIDLTGFGEEPVFLAYKPRRRAVVRFGDHVVKVYANDADFAYAARGLSASSKCSSFPRPTREAEAPELRLTVQTVLEGRGPASTAKGATRAGELLARVHTAEVDGLPRVTAREQLAGAAASGALLGVLEPDLAPRVRRLLGALEEQRPDHEEPVTSHGDFNASQLIEGEHGLGLVDFDAMCVAPPARDPCTYAAYVLTGGESGPAPALALLDALLEGYGSRPPDTEWYLSTAILRRAPQPFRRLEPDWPRLIERMLNAAEKALVR